MSSSAHLGSQSNFEPGLTEPRPSRFKPDPQKSQFSNCILDNLRDLAMEINTHNEEEEQNRKVMRSGKDCNAKAQKKSEMGGCSFLQSLAYSSSRIIKTEKEEEKLYVHPLTRTSSSSTLSLKSLEMCTESLGSETGSEESEKNSSNEESHLVWSVEAQKNPRIQSQKSKRVKNRADFPPPLTSIRSPDGVRMKSHRENGRLVLKAEFGHCCRSYFQAERGNGRLRLRLRKNWSSYKETEGDEEEEEEDIEGNSEIVGGEMGIEKFPLPGQCKKCGTGGQSQLNRAEPFWVATTT